ncbi:hypothetical protein [Bosea sp. (in: a-proteobacteria)]|uniref:hypothetical protein n=1 Tax=Bosea sp. (in: a-proteobacteria) TaxID=1871050 RepID=UPI00262B495D|nr:hypothetical protein [Bosea sp. (in: a-proteobacteria)]MCO5091040.1 hypothetical protein [Bosea sp. (in: a-proteobacteria)]
MPRFDLSSQRTPLALQYAYLGTLAYLLVNLGGVDPYSLHIGALLAAAMTAVAAFLPVHNRAVQRLGLAAGLILTALAMLALVQSLRWDGNPFEHPAWQTAREVLGPVSGAISVSPAQTRNSLLALAPVLGFLVVLRAVADQDGALAMLRRLAYLSAVAAAFGLIELFFFPTDPLSAGVNPYRNSLTSFFVNRNSAGTFFGLGLLVSVAFCFHHLRTIEPEKFLARLGGRSGRSSRSERRFLLFTGLAFIQLLALFLTQSRGAIGATLLALLLFVAIMARHRLTASRNAALPASWLRLAKLGGLALGLWLIYLLLGGRVAYRIERAGLDDTRFCAFGLMGRALVDNLPLGTGFGTFQDIFPAYRDHDCAGIAGVWDAAHNGLIEGGMGLGLLFLVLAPVAIVLLARAFLTGLRERQRYRFVPALGLAGLLLISLHSLVDFSLQIPAVAFYAAAILGCCTVISLGRREA